MSEETTQAPAPAEKPAAKAPKAKVKEPTVEDLPFEEFVTKHYVPTLAQALAKKGLSDLQLKFENSQVRGTWANGQRQFAVYFSKQDIHAQKAFSCADAGKQPSTLEPFLIDERKATLDLLVFGVSQRLNAQKWLYPN
jgi:hypothetical protein